MQRLLLVAILLSHFVVGMESSPERKREEEEVLSLLKDPVRLFALDDDFLNKIMGRIVRKGKFPRLSNVKTIGPSHDEIEKVIIHSQMHSDPAKKAHQAASFLDSYLQNKCALGIDREGRRTVECADLHSLGKHTLTFAQVDEIMCGACISIKDHLQLVKASWKKLHDDPFALSEADKFLALVYVYACFVEGYDVTAHEIKLVKSEDACKTRREYQMAWRSFDSEKIKSIKLYSESEECQPFLQRLVTAMKLKKQQV